MSESNDLETHEFGECGCHKCGEVCNVFFDSTVNTFVSECHGVGFDYTTPDGEIKSIGDDLRYIEDWNE